MASKLLSTLHARDLRLVLGAYVIDDTASWGYTVVLAAYAYTRTGSTGWIAFIACARWIVGLLVSGAAGVLADRYDRARLVAATGAVCAVSMAGLAVVVGVDGPLWLLPALSALDTALSAPVRPATGALVPDIVGDAELIAANGLFAILENVVVVLGPAIGGLLLLAGTPATAIALNAASYLVSAAVFLRVRTRSRGDAGAATEGRLAEWNAGIRALGRTRTALMLTVFIAFAAGIYGAAIVVYAPLSIRFGTGADGYSYLLAASAAGGVLAAVLAERLAKRARLAPLLVGAVIAEAVPFALSDVVRAPVLGAVLQAVSGGGMVVLDVLAITALQRDLARDLLGRALAATGAVALAATVVTNLGASALISSAGLSWTLAVIGIGFPAAALLCLPILVANDRAGARWRAELQPVVALLERLELFDGAPQRVLEQLAADAGTVHVDTGTVVIQQGDAADALWLLAEGRLGVQADGRDLPDVTAPGYVGELGLLKDSPRSATVTAAQPCELIRIDASAFRAAVEASASSVSLMTLAGERLARTRRPRPAALPAQPG